MHLQAHVHTATALLKELVCGACQDCLAVAAMLLAMLVMCMAMHWVSSITHNKS